MERKKQLWVYGLSALFILLNAFFITKEIFWFMLLPVMLLVAIIFLFSLDKLLLLIAFLTPLAVNIREMDLGFSVSIPTEPLLFGVLILFVLRQLLNGRFDKKILRHPVSLAIFLMLIWLFVTTLTSQLPVVSLKYLLSRLWFIIPMFLIGTQLFRKIENIPTFIWLYVIGMTGIVFFTIIKHASFGFNEDIGHWVMRPFYNDHTAYGAMLAFFIPALTGFVFYRENSRTTKLVSMVFLGIFVIALFLSFSRAAWISVVFSFGVYILFLLRIKFRWVALGSIGLILTFFALQNQILERLERNKQDSSTDLVEHIRSITNITSDASNLERINRWQSALRMFRERPVLGWGPGTYQFLYAPYQHSQEKTIISTNAGDMGNAHSEYIGPMAESGVGGLITVSLLMIVVLSLGLRLARHAPDPRVRMYALVLTLGLITYYAHGILNNFLDTDKASVPFWAFIGMLVAMDVYHKNPDTESPETAEEEEIISR